MGRKAMRVTGGAAQIHIIGLEGFSQQYELPICRVVPTALLLIGHLKNLDYSVPVFRVCTDCCGTVGVTSVLIISYFTSENPNLRY